VLPELLAVSDKVCPVHSGELLPAAGVDGGALTVTFTDAPLLVQPSDEVAVTLYVPEWEVDAEVITGFCWDDVNPFGPDHE
jgi:hypothetical protein